MFGIEADVRPPLRLILVEDDRTWRRALKEMYEDLLARHEIEWAFADGMAIEFELPFADGDLEAYKVAAGVLPPGLDQYPLASIFSTIALQFSDLRDSFSTRSACSTSCSGRLICRCWPRCWR